MTRHHHQDAYDQVTDPHHKGSLTHEALAAAAAWQAMKAYNEHQAKYGKVNHETAKKVMAAASAAFIDHMIETKGLDAIDRARAKKDAEHHQHEHLKHHY